MISFLVSEPRRRRSCRALWQACKRQVHGALPQPPRRERQSTQTTTHKDCIYNTLWIGNCQPGGNYRWKWNALPICRAGLLRLLSGVRETLLHRLWQDKMAVSQCKWTQCIVSICSKRGFCRIQSSSRWTLMYISGPGDSGTLSV